MPGKGGRYLHMIVRVANVEGADANQVAETILSPLFSSAMRHFLFIEAHWEGDDAEA